MRLHVILIAAAVTATLAASPARAQFGNPGFMKPASPEASPGKPEPDEPGNADRLFVQLVGAGSMAEIDAGKLAGSRARSGDVKAFAQRMVQDHGTSADRLGELARQAAIPMPKALDPDHQAMRRELDSADAATFDGLYLHGQLIDHQKTVQLLEWEIDSGQDASLRRFAADTLPAVLDHLRLVQQLLASETGAPPQGLATLAASHSP